MRKTILLLVTGGALALAACDTVSNVAAGTAGLPASPAAVCDRSQLDENAGIAVEAAYKAWRMAFELGLDSGIVKGPLAAKLAALDRTAYGFTVATQSAYKACNAAGYVSAAREATNAVKAAVEAMRNR